MEMERINSKNIPKYNTLPRRMQGQYHLKNDLHDSDHILQIESIFDDVDYMFIKFTDQSSFFKGMLF